MAKKPARERILETASELFQARGYKEVGINEIIASSGTAKATFYSNFASKQLLGEAWLAGLHTNSIRNHAGILSDQSPVRERLSNYFKDLESFLVDGSFRGCPFTNTSAVISDQEPLLQEQVRQHKESVRQFFKELVEPKNQAKSEVFHLGDQIFLLYSGATNEAQNLQSTWPVKLASITALALLDDSTQGQ